MLRQFTVLLGISCLFALSGLGACAANESDGGESTEVTCNESQKYCEGRAACYSLDDPDVGCGSEGCVACPTPPVGTYAACEAGICTFECDASTDDCDGDPTNGCETELGTTENCGACDAACPEMANATASCTWSGGYRCVAVCETGYYNLDGNHENGCEGDEAANLAKICSRAVESEPCDEELNYTKCLVGESCLECVYDSHQLEQIWRARLSDTTCD